MNDAVSAHAQMIVPVSAFELPEDAKITKVFERLMRANAVATEKGLRELYSEVTHNETYGIGWL